MVRWILASAVLATGIGVVAAQDNLVNERAEVMYDQGKIVYGTFNKMIRGEQPYDQATVDADFAKLKETSHKLPTLYPASAKGQSPDADYYASDKVWENKTDFDARLQKLIKDIDANAPKATSLDGLKTARATIMETCNDCHETYRVKKN